MAEKKSFPVAPVVVGVIVVAAVAGYFLTRPGTPTAAPAAAPTMNAAETAALARVKEVDIVGHYDLLTKFDEQWTFFDPDSPRFRAAATDAMDLLIAAGKIFEINTGAISRGYRTTPYPSETLLRELFARGAKVTISADAHRTQDVAFGFAQAEALARRCGYREAWQFSKTGFVAVPLDETV